MAEIIARDTYSDIIRRTHEFATHDEFPTRLIRMVRTRTSLLHRAWTDFQQAHINTHKRRFVEIEELFVEADAIMQERIAEFDPPEVDANRSQGGERELESDDEHDNRSVRSSQHGSDNEHQQNNSRGQSNPTTSATPAGADVVTPNVQVGNYGATGQSFPQMPWQFRIENIWGEFDGDKEQWLSFHDSFKANVYDDPLLPPVRKFQILKAALKGKAAKSLGQWQVCDNNFEPAWQRLKKLYHDPYGTSNQLLQRILSLTKLDAPNGYKLQIISNVAQEVSRQLSALGLPAEHYDLMFIHAVQGKLDQKTSMDWDSLRGDNAQPTLIQFTDFLDARAKALNNAYQSEHGHENHKNKDRKRPSNDKPYQSGNKRFKQNTSSANHTVIKQEKQGCAMCSGEHLTRKCDKFVKLSLHKRKEKAKEANLCFNCLGRNHAVKDCKAGTCNRCEKKHNSMLCPENPNNRQLNANQVAKNKSPKKHKKPANKSQ